MPAYTTAPLGPLALQITSTLDRLKPEGPVASRRMSDLEGLFADSAAWEAMRAEGDPLVYEVAASPVPEFNGEVPQSITTIHPGNCGGEFFMTKGHQHTAHQGEVYLGLAGTGALVLFDGREHHFIEMTEMKIGYIPPGWAHRSVNVGHEPYRFLAVYPGSAGHDYTWVLEHGMGCRVRQVDGDVRCVPDGD